MHGNMRDRSQMTRKRQQRPQVLDAEAIDVQHQFLVVRLILVQERRQHLQHHVSGVKAGGQQAAERHELQLGSGAVDREVEDQGNRVRVHAVKMHCLGRDSQIRPRAAQHEHQGTAGVVRNLFAKPLQFVAVLRIAHDRLPAL